MPPRLDTTDLSGVTCNCESRQIFFKPIFLSAWCCRNVFGIASYSLNQTRGVGVCGCRAARFASLRRTTHGKIDELTKEINMFRISAQERGLDNMRLASDGARQQLQCALVVVVLMKENEDRLRLGQRYILWPKPGRNYLSSHHRFSFFLIVCFISFFSIFAFILSLFIDLGHQLD